MNRTIAWVVVAIIVIAGIWYFSAHNLAVSPANNSTSTSNASSSVYENQYIKLTLANGWTAQDASGLNREGAVNITKGNYILYINPNASQASGVTGGRFAEVAMGSPSANLVVNAWPGGPCGTNDKVKVTDTYYRVDEYINNSVTASECNKPTASGDYWYFGYLTTAQGGYFNDYQSGTNPGLVATMSYQASNINSLPIKGNSGLTQALSEMDSMLKTLQIKSHL